MFAYIKVSVCSHSLMRRMSVGRGSPRVEERDRQDRTAQTGGEK